MYVFVMGMSSSTVIVIRQAYAIEQVNATLTMDPSQSTHAVPLISRVIKKEK